MVTCGRTDAEVVFVDGQEFDKLWRLTAVVVFEVVRVCVECVVECVLTELGLGSERVL